jgi:uncharacterized membrane protein YphA (DoxX/SURF4 family)
MTGIVRFFLAVFLGGVFVFAGAMKIFDPPPFAQSISNYHILPHEMVNLTAITLPWIEWISGAMLLTGIWVRANAILIGVMLTMFIIAILAGILRGLNIECGCYGNTDTSPVGWMKIGENAIMLIMAIWIARKTND